MAESTVVESILVADCGTAMTKVFLFDSVDGQYRFVARGDAPSTVAPPNSDVIIGVQMAVQRLEELVGRRLLSEDGDLIRPERSDGTGVDAFVAVSSAGAPLRVALAGLDEGGSLTSLERASWGTPSQIVSTLALGDPGVRPDAQIMALRDAAPDAVIIAGGTDTGAIETSGNLADIVGLACSLIEKERRPEVLFSGNVKARSTVADRLSSVALVKPVENITPVANQEVPGPVLEELHRLYVERKMTRVPGFGRLSAWSSQPVKATCEVFGHGIRFLARQYDLNVLGVDMGSSSTVLASVVDGLFDLTVGTGVGVGHGAAAVMRIAGAERLARWAARAPDSEAVGDAVWNKSLRPNSIGTTMADAEAEQALARECLRLTAGRAAERWAHGRSRPYPDLPPFWDLIVASGAFLSSAPTLGRLALMLLDGLQPVGLSTVACDSASMVGALAAAAPVNALAGAQVMEHDALLNLGTIVCPVGLARQGERVMRAKVTGPDGKARTIDVSFGDIVVVPLPPSTRASLEMRPSRNFDIGWGRKGRGAVAEVEGGLLGLIIDARGRPLVLPEDADTRRARVIEWQEQIGA